MPALNSETSNWLIEQEMDRLGVREFYDHLLSEGNSPRFAAMLASRQPPGTKGTDRTMFEGSHRQFDRMRPENAEAIQRIAKRAGINTAGKVYKSGLGRYDDPMAWVSSVSDIKKACEVKGLSSEGAFTYKSPEQPPPKPVKLAEDIVQECIVRELAADPALAERAKKQPKVLKEVREKVVDKHTPNHKRHLPD